jgi:hypothetical protein
MKHCSLLVVAAATNIVIVVVFMPIRFRLSELLVIVTT